jgi:hypothetical protein
MHSLICKLAPFQDFNIADPSLCHEVREVGCELVGRELVRAQFFTQCVDFPLPPLREATERERWIQWVLEALDPALHDKPEVTQPLQLLRNFALGSPDRGCQFAKPRRTSELGAL